MKLELIIETLNIKCCTAWREFQSAAGSLSSLSLDSLFDGSDTL